MKALILAAGFGKRLRPLTLKRPKALVPVLNIPVIERNIHFLRSHGITEIIINTHHLYKHIENYISENDFGVPIRTIFEPHILGTGGAIKNVSSFWGSEPFLVMNADIITDIDISKAYEWHIRNDSLVTLILHDYPHFRKIVLDENHSITQIKKEEDSASFSFTGIHILNSEIINYMPDGAFDIIDFYREMIKRGIIIKGYISSKHYWTDVGTIKDYIKANREALKDLITVLDKSSLVNPSVTFIDWAIVGKKCVIEKDCLIARSILWENTIIKEGTKIEDSIITGGVIEKDLKNIVA